VKGRERHFFQDDSAEELSSLPKEARGRAAMKGLDRGAGDLPPDFGKLEDFDHGTW
jgi:hypothetical protein